MNSDTSARRTLQLLLAEGRACRWQKSKGPKRPDYDDDTGKPVGAAKSDPTADAALDPVRLALSAAVKRGELALVHGTPSDWRSAAVDLEAALNAWGGHG